VHFPHQIKRSVFDGKIDGKGRCLTLLKLVLMRVSRHWKQSSGNDSTSGMHRIAGGLWIFGDMSGVQTPFRTINGYRGGALTVNADGLG
jgi:hypothetical protein